MFSFKSIPNINSPVIEFRNTEAYVRWNVRFDPITQKSNPEIISTDLFLQVILPPNIHLRSIIIPRDGLHTQTLRSLTRAFNDYNNWVNSHPNISIIPQEIVIIK